MIKQIQLRGISRTPSDKMSEDGGLSESLNMYLDTAEQAPALVPEDVTGKLGLPVDLEAERIFIHKTANYKNYIVVQSYKVVAYTPGIEDEEPLPVMELAEGETVNDITSVGNTLVITTTSSLYYILYKERNYVFLGENVPFPSLEFFDVRTEIKPAPKVLDYSLNDITTSIGTQYLNQRDTLINENGCYAVGTLYQRYDMDPTDLDYVRIGFYDYMWNEVDENGNNTNPEVLSAINSIKGLYDKMKEENRKLSIFTNPIWACYAVRLFNDSLLVSTPQLISPGIEDPIELCGFGGFVLGYGEIMLRLNHFYKLGVRILDANGAVADQWKDIIKGIEIFISEDINRFDIGSITIQNRESFQSENFANVQFAKFKIKGKDSSFIKDALNKSVFAKVESFYIDENFYPDGTKPYSTILSDYTLDPRTYIDNAKRMLNDKLSDFSYSMDKLKYKATSLNVFNNSLMLVGSSFQYPNAPEWFSAQRYNTYLPRPFVRQNTALGDVLDAIPDWWFPEMSGGNNSASEEYDIAINISTSTSEATVYGKNPYRLLDRYEDLIPNVYSLILYPSADCQSLYVRLGNKIKKRNMVTHPALPKCSYYYENTPLGEGMTQGQLPNEFNKGDGKHYIKLANSENPLFIEHSIQFQSNVIGVAVATTALSQGQFGQFPLYVFTEDGIWAMETAADGSFVSQKPLSREVCINPDSITSIDNAVVFVTDKGVMMIQGSQVMNISPYMNGRHYIPNDSATSIIARQEGFGEFENAIKDETPFVAFMKKAKIAYDYAGQRLICIADDEAFQYIYKIDTQTWHKVAFSGLGLSSPLNSYPECLVMGSTKAGEELWLLITEEKGHEITPILIEEIENAIWDSYDTIAEEIGVDADFVTDFVYGRVGLPIHEPDISRFREKLEQVLLGNQMYYNLNIRETKYAKVYSLGTILDIDPEAEDAPKVAKGILITRPFDLGMPDVFKSITSIKIRGDFDKGNVKYILQGSNDGKTFYTMNTLRGKSWKMFRIFILADLEPTERISWIDIDFEPRYNNRLR